MAHLLLSSLLDSLSLQDKARIEVFKIWMDRLLYFVHKDQRIRSPEELKSIEEEKQIFHNEIGIDVNLLYNFQKTCFDFRDKILCQTTDEGIKFVLEEMTNILFSGDLTLDVLLKALDKYILEKNKNEYTAPAA